MKEAMKFFHHLSEERDRRQIEGVVSIGNTPNGIFSVSTIWKSVLENYNEVVFLPDGDIYYFIGGYELGFPSPNDAIPMMFMTSEEVEAWVKTEEEGI